MTAEPHRRLLGAATVVLLAVAAPACSGSGPGSTGTAGPLPSSSTPLATSVPTSAPTIEPATSVGPGDPTAPVITDSAGSGPETTAGATTSVVAPPPTGQGGTVPVATIPPQPPTPIDSPATDAGGLQFSIGSLIAIQGEPSGPGEVGGPALQLTLTAVNTSSAPVDVSLTLVDLRHGTDQVPAAPFALGTTPLVGTLAPGASATGVYVFGVPLDQRSEVRIYVSARPDLPAVVFEGAVG